MSLPSLAIISRHAPHGTAHGQEALDLALVSGTFGQAITLFFIGDGVYQLLQHQQTDMIGRKNYSKTFAALDFYDVSQPVVCTESLAQRGISSESLCIEANLQPPENWRALLNNFDQIVTF
ncbi:sulfurtransferase complex subunit TusC [Lacimicrobium alkaliphilum]|uniref:Sulfurtransferase TusC n=1 Tax=Lacimicrobium alkaliphilum TaxID=1526571 RepID=A0ABQ1RT66_9ALTE|nr:sulfurtransferase complex subunit TusC [Lacimicrobium alkaliphilum]GGD78093.1 sulfurtransferase TusC [Lacimicrobium alkaliphilum]